LSFCSTEKTGIGTLLWQRLSRVPHAGWDPLGARVELPPVGLLKKMTQEEKDSLDPFSALGDDAQQQCNTP